jgi:hypothetical protein
MIRAIQDGDYENILTKWWSDWGFPSPPPKDSLPKTSYIAYDGDTPVSFCALYLTNSSMAWLTWILSNKEYRKKPHRKIIIQSMIENISDIALNGGAKSVYTVSDERFSVELFKSVGFRQTSSKATELIKTWE